MSSSGFAGKITPEREKEIEAHFANTREAFELLGLIDAEFRSDPMSVQCFDLRIVERVRTCLAARAAFLKNNPFVGDA